MPIEPMRPMVVMRPATIEDIISIRDLWEKYGEENVDVRPMADILASIESRSLYVFVDFKHNCVVGTGAFYDYDDEGYVNIELGSSVWHPDYRGKGFADISIAFRSIYSMLTQPGSRCVSELYETSKKSKAVLERMGFRQVTPTSAMAKHAEAVSSRPVIHMALDQQAVPRAAQILLSAIEVGQVQGGAGAGLIRFDAVSVYHLPMQSALTLLSKGDLSPINYVEVNDTPEKRKVRGVFEETVSVLLAMFSKMSSRNQ